MFILSKDKRKLINLNNVASICIKNEYSQHSHPSTWWEIRAMYPAVSNDVLCDTLWVYDTEELCRDAFNKLCCRIVSGKENEIIDMNDL